jgi:hypothetical protein
MGRINTSNERRETLRWAEELEGFNNREIENFSFTEVKQKFDDVLKKYFALACLLNKDRLCEERTTILS